MPIQLPDLDNRTFTDLMDEMVATIPKYTREWTNFNPSDPGIAILELLAWIAETLMYRANTVSTESYVNFLKLVAGDTILDESDQGHEAILAYLEQLHSGTVQPDLNEMKRQAASFLNSRYRAVTEEDFRQLAQEALSTPPARKVLGDQEESIRVEVIPGDYAIGIALILAKAPNAATSAELCRIVNDYLVPRKLLGAILNVFTASYTPVSLYLDLVSYSYADEEKVKEMVKEALLKHFAPVYGGPGSKGWPYGRNVVVYELCNVVEKVPGVKMVRNITTPSSFPIEIEGVVDPDGSEIAVKVTREGGAP